MHPTASQAATVNKTIQLSFRLPSGLVRELDRYAGRMRVKNKGAVISRADAVRALLLTGLKESKRRTKQQ